MQEKKLVIYARIAELLSSVWIAPQLVRLLVSWVPCASKCANLRPGDSIRY
jgi:hypothetical protein